MAAVQKLASIRPLGSRLMRPIANDRTCPNADCGASGAAIQEEDGKRVCSNCGAVVSDANIVSEVQFGEAASGAAVVQGSYVGPDQTHARSFGRALKRAGGMESREITDSNGRGLRKLYEQVADLGLGKRLINTLASTLQIDPQTAEVAFRYYKLAVAHNFIQGRRTRDVAACCLYVATRKVQHSHWMLIDFSDILQTNVFVLGHTYLKLVKDIPVGDVPTFLPEDLIQRFASRLEFGPMTNRVAQDAVKLVQQMGRDWIATGRRPSGICGACLILAARMNNFRRTVREMVYIAKVTDSTILKRLEEFKVTKSSKLTVDQFRVMEPPSLQHDPPSFYAPKSKKRKRRDLEETLEDEEVGDDNQDAQEEDSGVQPDGQFEGIGPEPSQELRRDADGFVIPQIPIDPALLAASNFAHSELGNEESIQSLSQADSNSTPSTSVESSNATSSNPSDVNVPVKRGPGRPKGSKNAPKPVISAEELAFEEELEDEIEAEILSALHDPDIVAGAEDYAVSTAPSRAASREPSRARSRAPSQAPSLSGVAEALEYGPGELTVRVSDEIDISDTEFDDDPEVANCLLSEAESALKETIWVHVNKDYLREQQRKRLRAETAERTGANKIIKRRKRKPRIGEGVDDTPASSPAEAARGMLMRRGFSKKINYDALNSLFDAGASSTTGSIIGTSTAGSAPPSVAGADAEGETA
jgi:transcription factor IIIB subunit 2